MMFASTSVPVVLNTLIANTSGPFGKVPLPPNVVFVSSFNCVKSKSARAPGCAINDRTVSPGCP